MVYILCKFNQIYEAINNKIICKSSNRSLSIKSLNKLCTFSVYLLQNNFKVLIKTITRNGCSLLTTAAGTGAPNI